MSLLSVWALAGLVVLVPLVLAHLRSQQRPVHDVPSLLLWREFEPGATVSPRRLRLPLLPILLLLQALALVLLVLALARPTLGASPTPGTRVYVLDDSVWMQAQGRLAVAEHQIERSAAALAPRTPVQVVVADGAPHVAYRGPSGGGVLGALRRVRPSDATSTLADALTIAAGLESSRRDRVVVVRAPEDAAPPVTAPAGSLRQVVVGTPVADQGIMSPSARCGIGGPSRCEVLAIVRNQAPTAVTDRYTADADGRRVLSGSVRVGGRSSADIVLSAVPDQEVRLRLDGRDVLPADNQAWVTVPGPGDVPAASTVTLVGVPTDALPVARALAAVPGVHLRLRTPHSYRAADARSSQLTVLDGWLPRTGLPPSPSVVLINPPGVPGGHAGGTLADTTVSGTDAGSNLLAGVDLTSLAVDRGAAHRLTLPRWLQPVVWSPAGPLLAAGDDGSQHLAVLAFDPAQSDLPQLASFPILAANLVRWATGWVPSSAPAGEPLQVDGVPGAQRLTLTRDGRVVTRARLKGAPVTLPIGGPGLYRLTEAGPGVSDQGTIAVSGASPSAAPTTPVELEAGVTSRSSGPRPGAGLAPWFLGAALAAIALEWAYWRRHSPAVVTS